MMRIGDTKLFQMVAGGSAALFPHDRPRTVRFTVMCPVETVIDLLELDADGMPSDTSIFTFPVKGLEDVEFVAAGAFAVSADTAFFLKSVDGTAVHVEAIDAETFTQITERQPRDPRFEAMQAAMMANTRVREQALREEFDRRETTLLEAIARAAGAPGPGGEEPAPDGDTGGGEPDTGENEGV